MYVVAYAGCPVEALAGIIFLALFVCSWWLCRLCCTRASLRKVDFDMGEVLATASGIAGLASVFFQLFEGCVKGFILLRTAQGYGSRAETFGCQLEWEHYHLHRWASLAGLFKEPPEVNVPNLPLVARTLQNLERILTNADKLQEHYNLKIEITTEELDAVQASQRLFGNKLSSTAGDFVSDSAKVYQRRASPWQKLKWATFDQNAFKKMIDDIHAFNEHLRSTLHQTEQSRYSGSSSDTLRSIVSQATDKVTIDIVLKQLQAVDSVVEASARLKEKGLRLEVIEGLRVKSDGSLTPAPATPSSSSLTLPSSSSTLSSHRSPTRTIINVSPQIDFQLIARQVEASPPEARHELATYHDHPVILEWKIVPPNFDKRLRTRVAAVAELLSSMTDDSFHSLPCIGYTRERGTTRCAYIFKVPMPGRAPLRALWLTCSRYLQCDRA